MLQRTNYPFNHILFGKIRPFFEIIIPSDHLVPKLALPMSQGSRSYYDETHSRCQYYYPVTSKTQWQDLLEAIPTYRDRLQESILNPHKYELKLWLRNGFDEEGYLLPQDEDGRYWVQWYDNPNEIKPLSNYRLT